MSGRVDGKVALVTGAARGMGLATSRLLASEGARVVLTDVLVEEGRAAAAAIGDRARFVELNVADAVAWADAVAAAEQAFGPLTVLVNNAGVATMGALDEFTEADYRRVIDINQIGVFLGIKAAVGSMRAAGGGSIVNISSAAGLAAIPGAIAYVSSKFAVRGLTKAAALDLGASKIRVNSVHPGPTRTAMFEDVEMRNQLEGAVSQLAIPRLAEPEEIAATVLFLASEESSYSTGAEFIVDGGWTCM